MIYVVFLLIAGAAALYLLYSDTRTSRSGAGGAEGHQQIRDRQTAIRLSLNDLQYELSVGKIEQQDFARLQSELLAEWESLEGRLAAIPATQKKQVNECGKCGATLVANAKFCHACGAKVLQLLLLLLFLPAGQLDALDIRVQIRNGTTGNVHSPPLKVQLLKLEKGMQPVTAKNSQNGRAEFLQLPENAAGPYMVQTEYQSVTYSKVIPPNLPSPADVTLDVYESTTSAERVRVRTLVEIRRVAEDKLAGIMILFFMNQDNRTFIGQRGLEFFLPAQAVVEQASVSVGSGASNIQWLKVTAEKTGVPGAYRIAQSVKPGERIVQVTFSLPYAAAGTSLSFRSVYPQDAGLQLIAEPENLEVRQAGRQLARVKDANLGRGLISFPAAESRIELKLSGGSIAEGRADESEAELVVRSPLDTWQKLLFPLVALILFFVVFHLRERLRAAKSGESG
jgi:ribosomal protein L40E